MYDSKLNLNIWHMFKDVQDVQSVEALLNFFE